MPLPPRPLRLHERVDFDELNRLADAHLARIQGWRRAGDARITCDVARHGTSWTVEVRCVSTGGASRHLWFKGNEMVDAVDLAKTILRGPWRGWEIFE